MRGHRPDSSDSDSRQNFGLAGSFDGSSQTSPRPEASSLMMMMIKKMMMIDKDDDGDLCRLCFFHYEEDGDEEEVYDSLPPLLTQPHYLKSVKSTHTLFTLSIGHPQNNSKSI